ncbi:MAG TPA: hypothetical protein VGC40_01395 [Paenirhodobacter sp.]
MTLSKTARLDRGFTAEPQGDGSVLVSGRGAGLKLAGLIVIGLVALIPVTGLCARLVYAGPLGFLGNGLLFWTFTLLVLAAVLWGANRLKSPRFAFRMIEKGIERGGMFYPYAEISEVFVDNGHSKNQPVASGGLNAGLLLGGSGPVQTSAIVTGVMMANAASAVTTGAINLSARIGAAVNYRVNLRHGRKVVKLARSLDEQTAVSLFHFLTEQR